jgi:hypothetical protein
MPNLGAPELIIMLFAVVMPVIVVVAIVAAVRRPGRRGPAPATAPPGWLTDPMQRHQYRYWDGAQWTGAVSDDGAESSDPL